jgi:lipocalin
MDMRIVLFTSLLVTTMAQTPATVRTVPAVDLDRYAGDWFEVARVEPRSL